MSETSLSVMTPIYGRGAQTIEVITLKLMEYLYPYIVANQTSLHLISRSAYYDWQRFLRCVIDTRKFSPRRLMEPLYDDRFYVPCCVDIHQQEGIDEQQGNSTGKIRGRDEEDDQVEKEERSRRLYVCQPSSPATRSSPVVVGEPVASVPPQSTEDLYAMEVMEAYQGSQLQKQHLNYLKDFSRRLIHQCLIFDVERRKERSSSSSLLVPMAIPLQQRILFGRMIIHTFSQKRSLFTGLPLLFKQLLQDDIIPSLIRRYPLSTFYNTLFQIKIQFQQIEHHRMNLRRLQRSEEMDPQLQQQKKQLEQLCVILMEYLMTFYQHFLLITKTLTDIFLAYVEEVHSSEAELIKTAFSVTVANRILDEQFVRVYLHVPPDCTSSSTSASTHKAEDESTADHMLTLVKTFKYHLKINAIQTNEVLLDFLDLISYHYQPYGGSGLEHQLKAIRKDKRLLPPTVPIEEGTTNDPSSMEVESVESESRHYMVQVLEVHIVAPNKTIILKQDDSLVKSSRLLQQCFQVLLNPTYQRYCKCSTLILLSPWIPDAIDSFLSEYAVNPMNTGMFSLIKHRHEQIGASSNKVSDSMIEARMLWDNNNLFAIVQPVYALFAESLSVRDTIQLIRIAKMTGLQTLQDLLTLRIAMVIHGSAKKEDLQRNLGIPVVVPDSEASTEEMGEDGTENATWVEDLQYKGYW